MAAESPLAAGEAAEKQWLGYAVEYYSAGKKERELAIGDSMNGRKGYMQSQIVRQRKTDTAWFHLHVESKKHKTNEQQKKSRNRPTGTENKWMVYIGEEDEGVGGGK